MRRLELPGRVKTNTRPAQVVGWDGGKRYLLSLDGTAEECNANDHARARVLDLNTNTLSGACNIHSLITKSLRRWRPATMDSARLQALLEKIGVTDQPVV